MIKKMLACLPICTLLASPLTTTIAQQTNEVATYTQTKESLSKMTPELALQHLKEGNTRFVANNPIKRNLLNQAKATKLQGQFPAAVILSCMDSRGSPELIFDQGLGDIFSIRVAGNVVNPDQLGSMEFATAVTGSKVIVVMGHTRCGAIGGACKNVRLGNLTQLLDKIQPAVKKTKENTRQDNLDCNDYQVVDQIAKQNVLDMIKQVKEQSPTIRDQLNKKQIQVLGAMHDLRSGRVIFFDETGAEK
jgi:carbonic anhydrase